jgi:hypothetical protein
VENDPLFYSGVGLIVIGILAIGIPLMNRRKEGEETAFFKMMDEQDSGAAPAYSGEEEYVDAEKV